MAGWANIAALKTSIDAGQVIRSPFVLSSAASGSGFQRLWGNSGMMTGFVAGSEPPTSPGVAYTNGVGGLIFPDRTPTFKYLLALEAMVSTASVAGTIQDFSFRLHDRLVGVSVPMTTATTVTVNSVALTRYVSGVGVELWVEVTTAITTSVTFIVGYTSDLGSGRTTPPITITGGGASVGIANAVNMINLQAGDQGVKSIDSVTISSADAAAVFNFVLLKPLVNLGLATKGGIGNGTFSKNTSMLFEIPAWQRIYDGATLSFHTSGQYSSSRIKMGSISIAYG